MYLLGVKLEYIIKCCQAELRQTISAGELLLKVNPATIKADT